MDGRSDEMDKYIHSLMSKMTIEEKIGQLTTDSLCLVVQEANPRLAFLYLNSKVIKERVNAQK